MFSLQWLLLGTKGGRGARSSIVAPQILMVRGTGNSMTFPTFLLWLS